MARYLPRWATDTLDGLLASGVIDHRHLEGVHSAELQQVAAEYVRCCASAQRFDAEQAVERARERSERARERQRQRKAAA